MDAALAALRAALETYAPLTDATWSAYTALCRLDHLEAGAFLCLAGEVPTDFAFVTRGLLRAFAVDNEGDEYNKVFFEEGSFPGAMAALLEGRPSRIAIQALEDTELVRIDHAGYRALLREAPDLTWLQVCYLERNWLLGKEPREVALVQEDATARYERFRAEHPSLAARLPLYHVASHLGITPTQLSRIRRAEKDA